MDVSVDLIANGKVQGDIANYLKTKGLIDPARMRPYVDPETGLRYISVYVSGDRTKAESYKAFQVNEGVLLPDEWKQLDTALMGVTRERLSGFDYLVNKGLVKALPNAMGTMVMEWRSASDSQEAIMSMDGVTRGKGDRTKFRQHYLPIPILHADYEINERFLAASRMNGSGLDTTEAEHAARRILEKQEDMLFSNITYSFGDKGDNGRNTIYSLVNYPDRNGVTLSVGWNESGKTPADIIADVVALKEANRAARFYGPYTLFIPALYDAVLDEEYSVSGSSMLTIRERLMKIDQIKEIVVVDRLADDNVLLVQTTPDVVRIINGFPLQNIHWETEGGMVHKYKVMTIRVPQIRSDYNGKNGIAHLA